MATVLEKLNLKDQSEIVVVNAPPSFEPELAALEGIRIRRSPSKAKSIVFSLAFVTRQAELDTLVEAICPKVQGDAILWFAYPKKSSRNYTCDFNRDTGWQRLGGAGYEGVQMVAIDQDWSALRFRHVNYIKNLKRDPKRTQSAEGRRRAGSAAPT